VQDFEQCTPDNDCSAYRVSEVKEALTFFAVDEPGNAAFISLDFSHSFGV
jgi:hypothetical protein